MAILLAVLFTVNTTAQAKQPPTKSCLKSLSWQREGYTKAHINVIQSIRQYQPANINWGHVRNDNVQCKHLVSTARRLRLAEQSRWTRLRLQPKGIRWIIRRQFRSAGRNSVLSAWKVVSCESNYNYREWNGADLGIWQIELAAHPEVTREIALSPEQSTAWAWRASKHGTDFSPTWVCATYYGIN